MKYKSVNASKLNWLYDFYKKCGYGSKFNNQDFVVYALDKNRPVGVGRLSEEQGVVVLRGMQVLADYRRRGIGKEILKRLTSEIGDKTCYCLPYKWLLGLYRDFGFQQSNLDEVPEFILKRYRAYREKQLDVDILVYRGEHMTPYNI